jgi:carboxymethylenebutenolidase
MSGSEITVNGPDGEFMAYLATPVSGSGPGVVVAQEIFGVNAFMRTTCDWLAESGYLALCPDLFWRQEPGVQLTDQSEAHWARAFELFKGFDVERGVADLSATIDTLGGVQGCSGQVGGLGYCLGGLLAYLMATRTGAGCSVGYYGVGIADHLGEAANITAPLMLHVASDDEFVPAEAQAAMAAGLSGNAHVTVHTYQGMDHAFARPGGAHYDAAAAQLANRRTIDFLNANLG